MSKTAEWLTIMAGLRGRRLAVFDDLQRGVPLDAHDTRVQEALGWLVFHRFAWHDGRTYVARSTAEARELWQKQGTANTEAGAVLRHLQESATPAAAPTPEPERPAVHAHQAQFFANV